MRRAMDELIIAGIKTNAEFHIKMCDHGNFTNNEIHTGFINELIESGWLKDGE